MSDENNVSDNTDDLSSLFDGSVTADFSAATMPTRTRGSMEPTFCVDDAGDNQQQHQFTKCYGPRRLMSDLRRMNISENKIPSHL